jgi:hypothetical protein
VADGCADAAALPPQGSRASGLVRAFWFARPGATGDPPGLALRRSFQGLADSPPDVGASGRRPFSDSGLVDSPDQPPPLGPNAPAPAAAPLSGSADTAAAPSGSYVWMRDWLGSVVSPATLEERKRRWVAGAALGAAVSEAVRQALLMQPAVAGPILQVHSRPSILRPRALNPNPEGQTCAHAPLHMMHAASPPGLDFAPGLVTRPLSHPARDGSCGASAGAAAGADSAGHGALFDHPRACVLEAGDVPRQSALCDAAVAAAPPGGSHG